MSRPTESERREDRECEVLYALQRIAEAVERMALPAAPSPNLTPPHAE